MVSLFLPHARKRNDLLLLRKSSAFILPLSVLMTNTLVKELKGTWSPAVYFG